MVPNPAIALQVKWDLPAQLGAALVLSGSRVLLAPSRDQAAESAWRPGQGQDPQRRPPAPP